MFDLAWSEIAVIAAVAVIVVGPKDLPEAIRGVAKSIQKLRRMAGEFQGHLDEVVREAKLEDVRDQIRDIRNFDLKGEVERAVDRDGSLRKTMNDDPFRAPPPPTSDAAPAMDVMNPVTAPVDATGAFPFPAVPVVEPTDAVAGAPARMAPAEVALDPLTLQPIAAPAPSPAVQTPAAPVDTAAPPIPPAADAPRAA